MKSRSGLLVPVHHSHDFPMLPPAFTRVDFRALALASALLAASVSHAQSVRTLLLEGDSVPGAGGVVDLVLDVAVDDSGGWLALVQLVDSTGALRQAVVHDGAAILVEGDPLFDPPGLRIERFGDVELGADGTVWWLADTDAPVTTDELVMRNLSPTAREGDELFDSTLPAGTFWRDFDAFRLNDQGELLILGDVDAPTVTGSNDAALVRQTFDAFGVLIDEEVLVLEGDPIQGTFDVIVDVGASFGGHDVAHSAGHWIAYARGDGGSNSDELILVDGVVVAQEGKPGPSLGTTWDSLSSNGVDITDDGHYVFRGSYSVIGGDQFEAIFLDGAPFVVEGDTSPSIAPQVFDQFRNNAPLLLGENGRVVYIATTDDPDPARASGLFVDDRRVVQEGVTPTSSGTVVSLNRGPNSFDQSPDGHYVVFEASTTTGVSGVYLLDLGLIREMESCAGNAGTLAPAHGLPLLGETVTFEMDGEQDMGVTPVFLLSQDPLLGWPPCGVLLPYGELLIDLRTGLGNPAVVLVGPPTDTSPVPFSVAVANDPALLGRAFYAQGLWWDAGDQSPAENLRLTNGLEITLAPR